MLVVIDIETAPGQGFEAYEDAALDHHRNRITQIAWATTNGTSGVTQSIDELNKLIGEWRKSGAEFGGQNFKFDLRTLITKGANLTSSDYAEDSMLQAVADYDKIPDNWLLEYENQRVELNKAGASHRRSGKHGLKTLAPYILGVEPFWETNDHDNADYALTDAKHTLALILEFNKRLKEKGCYEFYRTKLMRWARMFLDAELYGLTLDTSLMESKKASSLQLLESARASLLEAWKAPMAAYLHDRQVELSDKYKQMTAAALAKPTKAKRDEDKVHMKYANLYANAAAKLEPFNMDSPSQLMWLLRDYYDLDVHTVEGDESTGKSVLNKLAEDGRKDVESLLTYRKHSKLLKAFFPSYEAMQWNGRLHPSFNLNGTRTGRISCSSPNIQQTPADLHDLIIAGPGRKLICYDLSNIEPMLIAYLTECPVLCNLMINNISFHDDNVLTMFNLDCSHADVKKLYPKQRAVSKTAGLALLYGAGPTRLQHIGMQADMPFTEAQAREIYGRFKKKYEAVFAYKKELGRRLERGEAVPNLLGRLFTIPNRDDVYMKDLNTLIQGSGSDILIESACRANEKCKEAGLDAYFLASVHDELIFSASDKDAVAADSIIKTAMLDYKLPTSYGPISLKCEGGIFDYWKH